MKEVLSAREHVLKEAGVGALPDAYCPRPHVCDEILRILQGEIEVLFLESRPGFGATCFTSELARRVEAPIILLQIRTGSRLGYSASFLMESAVEQGKLQLGIQTPKIAATIGGSWRIVFAKLHRLARSTGKSLYIIVDGLHQIPVEDLRYAQEIIRELLAIGVPAVRHVIVEDPSRKYADLYPTRKTKALSLIALSRAESVDYLASAGIPPGQTAEIFQATRGVPGLLASAVRQLRSTGSDLSSLKPELNAYYEAEWRQLCLAVDAADEAIERTFASIAFSKRPLTPPEIAEMPGTSAVALQHALNTASFLRTAEQGGCIEFASNSHREFVAAKVARYKEQFVAIFIDKLLTDPKGKDAVQLLPSFFEEAKRPDELISFLGPENLVLYLSQTESLTAVRRRTELGLRTASSIDSVPDVLRFSLKTSIVRSLDSHVAHEAQLAALAELGHYEAAFELAQQATTKESRLAMLAGLASVSHRKGRPIEPSIADRIGVYVEQTALHLDRRRTLEIAEHLVGPFPELAVRLVEAAAADAPDYQDFALTQLVLSSRLSASNKTTQFSYVDRISDARLQQVLAATQAFFGDKSATDIKQSTSGLDRKARTFLLREWLQKNARHPEAMEIADFLLDEISRDPGYQPAAADLRTVAEPIKHASDKTKASALWNRVSALISVLTEIGSSVDRVRLQIELALGGAHHDLVNREDSLTEMYLYTLDVADAGTRLECFRWLLAAADDLDPDWSIERRSPFRTWFKEGLDLSLKETLAHTAEHVDVLRGVLAAAAVLDFSFGMEVIGRLNTEERRNEAYAIFLNRYLSRNKEVEVSRVEHCLDAITSPRHSAGALIRTLESLCRKTLTVTGDAYVLCARGVALGDPGARCRALRWAIRVDSLRCNGQHYQELLLAFREALDKVDRPWTRATHAHRFAESVAIFDRAKGEELYRDLEGQIRQHEVSSAPYASTLFFTARLAVVAVEGLYLRRLDNDEHANRLFSLISTVPSIQQKIQLFSEWGWRAYLFSRGNVVERICAQGVVPLVEALPRGDKLIRQLVIEIAFPLLFVWNGSFAKQLLSEMEESLQTQCIGETIHALISKRPPDDAYAEDNYRGCKIRYDEATRLLELVRLLKQDSEVVMATQSLCEALTSKGSIQIVSKYQRAELATAIEAHLQEVLPDRRNIQHEGWLIVGLAAVAQLRDWPQGVANELVQRALAVANTSDRVFLLAILAKALPTKFDQLRQQCAQEGEKAIEQIPSTLDQVLRRVSLSSSVGDYRRPAAEAMLRKALLDSFRIKDDRAAEGARKGIIDAAYQVSPRFAQQLVAEIDDDPARVPAKASVEDRLERHQGRQSLLRGEASAFDPDDTRELADAAWRALGSLNAGKAPPIEIDRVANVVTRAANGPLREVWACYAWALRNLQLKLQYTHEGDKLLLKVFEVVLVAAEVAARLGQRVCGMRLIEQSVDLTAQRNTSLMVGPLDRQAALDYIKGWFSTCEGTEVVVCDPYFVASDLEVLKQLAFVKAGKRYTVLTCTSDAESKDDLKRLCDGVWREIADTEPPEIRVIRVSYDGETKNGPIHDRWILGEEVGLKLGTSLGSVGQSKLSEISQLTREQSASTLSRLMPFILMRERWLDGKRLRYEVVDL